MRELDEQCARAMGWVWRWTPNGTKRLFPPHEETIFTRVDPDDWRGSRDAQWDRGVPLFSTNHEAARTLEDEIERRHSTHLYLAALIEQVRGTTIYDDPARTTGMMWAVIRATPEQRARAFLEAVKQ